ncbi:MAG: hypothetical protein AAF149_20545 [Bacteroidota bacterium]
MEESLTISKNLPPLKSMQYETLREIGIKHIQELSSKLWTDYNTHDPGITMLEVMSYVITDVGFRVNYDIKDILTQKIGDPRAIQNFYTACEILPNCPVTKNDFRKLMMDVEVVDETEDDCKYAGVKNAWITKSPDAEHKIYVNNIKSELSLEEVPYVETQDWYYVKGLHDILLEFDSCDAYGDLNSNTIDEDLVIYEHPLDTYIQGLRFNIKIEFPRWDDEKVDWENLTSVQAHIINVSIKIFNRPDNYNLDAFVTNKNEFILKGNKDVSGTISAIAGLPLIIEAVNNFIYDPVSGLLTQYVKKVLKIHEIVTEVIKTLYENRNLCDDYFRFHALKVEEILLCTDIEIDPRADVETVEAHIYHEISRFLSPQVNFYTLEEMLNKCRNANQYSVSEIRSSKKTITISQRLEEDINKDDVITLLESGENDREYTVACISENKENPDYTDIKVVQDIASNDFNAEAYLFKGTIDDTLCLTVDKIFEGPKLKHGFIDDEELSRADRMKYIHVSDLIKIIMDVEGVLAVRSIQIANRPQDNSDDIASKSVKWCLELAMEQNYVPRLNLDDSKITFFKDQLPYHAKREEVNDKIQDLESAARPQKIRYPKMNIPVPTGEFKDLENYTSLQEEFPQVYGVGSAGIPGLEALGNQEKIVRKTEVKQLKGFLLFFDQLLANYLSQLSHIKDLFSMNAEKDQFGDYLIDKTYFAQPLYDVVPNADPLYVDKAGHLVKLQEILEDQELYETRRNKFLDHMLGRFAETFTDYALLSYKVSGAKAPAELIGDKLKFLNSYPELSRSRGKGFNYLDLCKNWHIDNVSGLEKRVSLLTGIEERSPDTLMFRNNFEIVPDGDRFKAQVKDDAANTLLVSPLFESEAEVKESIETIIINGVCKENYEIVEEGGAFYFNLLCDDMELGSSVKTDYATNDPGGDADLAIDDLIAVIAREFFNNPEANRKNLSCPLLNYFDYEVTADMSPVAPDPPTFSITYTLYSKAFDFTLENALLEGSVTREAEVGDSEEEVLAKGQVYVHEALWDVINYGSSRNQYIFDPDLSPYTPPYFFHIVDKYGESIAQSIAKDFNNKIADEITSLVSGQVKVVYSTHHNGTYSVLGANVNGPMVSIEVDQTLFPLEFDGKLSWTETFTIVSIDVDNRIIEIDTDVTARVNNGDVIAITDSTGNNGDYSILSMEAGGAGTFIKVREPLSASEDLGRFNYTKTFDIVGITSTEFIIEGNADEEAIADVIQFIEDKFFAREGMHVIEHVLLRPRINEKLFVEPEGEVLVDGLSDFGQLYFTKTVPIVEANAADNTFKVSGDVTSEIAVTKSIHITGGSFNDGKYEVGAENIAFDGVDTIFTTNASESPVLFDLPDAPHLNGELVFIKSAAIKAVAPSENKIVIEDADALSLLEGNKIQISPAVNTNAGRYRILSVAENGTDIEITFDKVEQQIQDALLPVHLDQDCETCKKKDPYSCVVSVVLPYWPGRFTNLDFRKFMNKTLRLEAPAHTMLNICWIDCEQMTEFERKYKAWLIAIGKDEPDKVQQAKALAEFIDIITRIRNVYPTGTLHNCEEDDSLEGAIVLNNSVLGTF